MAEASLFPLAAFPLAAPASVDNASESLRLETSPASASCPLSEAQQYVYDYLLNIVKRWTPANVLAEFKRLFIDHADAIDQKALAYLYAIIFSNYEQEFRYTLKRSCYILINNWDIRRHPELIQQLIALFSDPILDCSTISPTLRRLRQWLRQFVASSDFQELKLYTGRYSTQKQHWTHHFTAYLLMAQLANPESSIEQRQAARKLSSQLREQFKFDLARYTALAQCPSRSLQRLNNPTGLGDRVLHLVKRIVLRCGFFSYPNLARIFLSQTQHSSYQAFKQSLLNYLTFAIDHPQFVQTVREQLAEKLLPLYRDRHDQPINSALLLRTANRLIDYLLTETAQQPSPLFILLLSKGNALLLVIVLLKIVLICPYVRARLETRMADLVRYYEQYAEQDCRWVVDFLEILQITLTIYTENVQYTLVNMDHSQPRSALYSGLQNRADQPRLETCRIFSQLRSPYRSLPMSGFSQPALAPDRPAEVLAGGTVSHAGQSI